jgi:hypothetical protein
VGEVGRLSFAASRVPPSPLVARPIVWRAAMSRVVCRAQGSTRGTSRSAKTWRGQAGVLQRNLGTRTCKRTWRPAQGKSATIRW